MIVMKYKTIKISEELHTALKKLCNEKGIKLNWWCNAVLAFVFTTGDMENIPKRILEKKIHK